MNRQTDKQASHRTGSMGSLFLLCISTILQRERMVYVAGKRFPLKNAVFQRQIAACGAVFRNGDRAGVQIEVFLAERLPRGYMCMAVQENIAGAERRQVRGWQTFRRAYRLSPGHAPRGLVQTTGTAGGYN